MLTIGGLTVYATGLLSFNYTANMFKTGYDASPDKKLALLCMLPYFQLNIMTFCAHRYSQFWEEYALWFIVYIGLLITNITGNMNLKSCANKAYNPIYADPFLFAVILYLDANSLLDPTIIK